MKRDVGTVRSSTARSVGIALTSVGSHMLLLGALGFMPSPTEFFERNPVEMEVIEPEPPPPAPPPVPQEEPKPPEPEPERPAPKPAAPKPAPEPTPTPEPPPTDNPPAAEAPVDFGGITQTADGSSSWSTVVGSGKAITAPVGRIAKVTGRDLAGGAPVAAPPALVAEGLLSRKPVPPPNMNELLVENYPPRARAQGVAGSASLRLRILSDGRTSDIRMIRETGDYGFGDACTKILRGRRWQPPLDREGRPVATEIRYECDFQVAY